MRDRIEGVSRLIGTVLLLIVSCLAIMAAPPIVCPAGTPIGSVDLRVRPANNGTPLPLKTINRLEEGDTILYRPLLRPAERRKGAVSLVLIPAVRHPDQENLYVLEPQAADEPQEWAVPARTSVAAFVYGPSGLNREKVRKFLAKDDELIAQLADYAEKTSQTEALIAALTSDTASADTVGSAMQGFASQYGLASQIDRTQPTNQQMTMLLRTLNPAVASYDPISPQPAQRIGQTASLATSVAALFFGSPVGLAAGGTAMLMEMRSLVFPNTIFRSSFAQPLPEDGLGLCGKRDAVAPHTKIAFLWATRVPNIGPPRLKIAKALSLPAGLKATLPVEPAGEPDWKFLERARKWALRSADNRTYPVSVHAITDAKAPDAKSLEVDLAKPVPPGTYRLGAQWDWDRFEVTGDATVAPLGTFDKAHLLAESQDRLVAKMGRVPVTLEGADFEFVGKAELTKPGDKFFTPTPVPFALTRGFREGQQDRMDVQINTIDLDPGDYQLMLTQPDGKAHPVRVAILPSPPRIDNLPVSVNSGDDTKEITLKGKSLDSIARIEAPNLKVTLGETRAGGTERSLTLEVDPKAASGETIDLKEWIENRTEPLMLRGAVQVTAPRPKILDSKLSLPPGVDVSINAGELPSGYSLSALLRVSGLGPNDALTLGCRGIEGSRRTIRPGAKAVDASVQQLGPEELFVTFDDSAFPNGCDLEATVGGADGQGQSLARSLGHVVRVPKIESLALGDANADSGPVQATLTGRDLETIDRTGWDPEHGTSVSELPTPIPGSPDRQVLRISLPAAAPASDAPLYVWLRGETTGRASTSRPQAAPRAAATKSRVTAPEKAPESN